MSFSDPAQNYQMDMNLNPATYEDWYAVKCLQDRVLAITGVNLDEKKN